MCCDSPSPPQADPNIGLAAQSNAETAKAMLEIGKDQLAWNKEQYADLAPTLKKIMQQQVDVGNISQEHADAQWEQYRSKFMPIEQKMADEAMGEGSEAQQASEGEKARAAVAGSYEAQRGTGERNLARMGVNPASGRMGDFERVSGNEQAASEAGASNTAAANARMRGIALRSGAAQFGRNMPQTGIASDALTLNAGTSAAGTGTGSIAAANAGANSALPWYGGGITANNSAGQLYLGQFGAQMQGYQASEQAKAGTMAGVGQVAGMAASAFI